MESWLCLGYTFFPFSSLSPDSAAVGSSFAWGFSGVGFTQLHLVFSSFCHFFLPFRRVLRARGAASTCAQSVARRGAGAGGAMRCRSYLCPARESSAESSRGVPAVERSQWRRSRPSGSFLKAQCVVLRSLFSLGGLLSRGDFSRRAVYLALKYTPGPSD